MSILARLQAGALRLGLDVERASAGFDARLPRLLARRGVDLVLDVGANEGQSGELLRRYGYGGEICSFEPLPGAFKRLAAKAAVDPHWQAINLALGDSEGTLTLNRAANLGASSSVLAMLPRHERAAPQARYLDTVEVPSNCLDSVWGSIDKGSSAAPFLKLDVQGFEGSVLDGASQTLDRVVGIQLEISLVALYEGAPTMNETLTRMEGLGLRLTDVEPNFFEPETGELLQMDAVFLRPGDE